MNSWIKSMSYFKYLIFTTIMILLFSCDINDILKDEDEKEEVQNTVEVGSDGGTINVDDLTISIPPGAFTEATNLKISSVPNIGSDEDIVTNVYSVEGIPNQFSKPIDISIKHNGNISEQSFLIIQEDSYIPSLGSISANNNYFEAVLSGDSIKVQIPVRPVNLAKVSSDVDIQDDSVWKMFATSSKKNHTTSNNHFNIIYNSTKDNITDIVALGQFLEDAYIKIQGLGFSYARRTTWPVQVYIENLANADYGLFNASYWSYNRDYMRFNRIHLSDQAAMKTTAIHEFFHLAQYLYDSRFAFNRASFQSPQHWFNEACAVWSEELVTNAQYISSTKGYLTEQSPFKGLQAGSEIKASEHGYGMSAFVKYIVGKYGQSVLVNVYNKLFAGERVVDAINNSIDKMLFIEYNLFLQQYAHGQLYPDVGLPVLLDILEDEFEIKSDIDTLKTFTSNYRELSGKIYSVKLDNPNFKDDASLEISIDEELCHITVFQYPEPNSPFHVIAEGGKNCIVPDLKGLKALNKQLLVMVTNGNLISSPSYSASSKDINVKMEVKNTKIIGIIVNIGMYNITLTHNDFSTGIVRWEGDSMEWSFSSGAYSNGSYIGSFNINENIISATFDDQNPDDYYSVSGSMSIKLLDGPRRLNISIDQTKTSTMGPIQHSIISYENIPFVSSNINDSGVISKTWDAYYVQGSNVANVNLSYSYITNTFRDDYVSNEIEDYDYFAVHLYY